MILKISDDIQNSFKIKIIPMIKIQSVVKTYKYHKESGIQIFTKTGKNYFLLEANNAYLSILNYKNIIPTSIQDTDPKSFVKSVNTTQKWIDGKITNFEYLIKLNIISGRSFKDVNQYPIFPWIFKNYENEKFDLDPSNFRDLSKPMGAINEERLNYLLEKQEKSYLYEICYSNKYWVNNCLARLKPFKKLKTPSNFPEDCNQLLTSVEDSFEKATTSLNNFYELIPEFFFLPEFLRDNNTKLGDVELPKWANKSAFEFIYLHRKALESKYVSSKLNEWIDLIWGYKQDGDNAKRANNLFNPNLYESNQKQKNPKKYFGQIPFKLFDKEHPKRNLIFKSPIQSFYNPNDSFVFTFDGLKKIDAVNVSFDKKQKEINVLIDSGNKIYQYILNFDRFKKRNFVVKISKNIDIKPKPKSFLNLLTDFYFKEESDDISVLSPMFIDSTKLSYIEDDNQTVTIAQDGIISNTLKFNIEIVSLMTNKKGWLAVSTKDSSVTLFDIQNIPNETIYINEIPSESDNSINFKSDSIWMSQNIYYGTISFFRDSIICIAINETFKSFVCGTTDNYLYYCRMDLNKMIVDKMIELDGKPNQIIVTNNFGFVVVSMLKISENQTINKLSVFSINGEEIRSIVLTENKNIVDMISVSSVPGGFDFIIMADNLNNIYVFETFYLNIDRPLYFKKCSHSIMKLEYIKCLSLLISFDNEKLATFYYLPINDF